MGAAKAPPQAIKMNRDLVRTHTFSIPDLDAVLQRPVRTNPTHRTPLLLNTQPP